MGLIIDFKTGKPIKLDNEVNTEDVVIDNLKYDEQDIFNSQVLTFLNALILCLDMNETYSKQFTDLINSACSTLERLINKKNNLE